MYADFVHVRNLSGSIASSVDVLWKAELVEVVRIGMVHNPRQG